MGPVTSLTHARVGPGETQGVHLQAVRIQHLSFGEVLEARIARGMEAFRLPIQTAGTS